MLFNHSYLAEMPQYASSILLVFITLVLYQIATRLQQKWQLIWFNPMLITIALIIPLLLLQNIAYTQYQQATTVISSLLEPAVVALGLPLYQQLQQIKFHWRQIVALLGLGVIVVITISFAATIIFISKIDVAVALSLKSVTTPIGIALTEQLAGDSSITAFAIIIAGLFGALLGPSWLNLIGVSSAKAQGLAVGAASHVIGTAVLAKISNEHAAYSSISLIFSALLTAIISPLLIPLLTMLLK